MKHHSAISVAALQLWDAPARLDKSRLATPEGTDAEWVRVGYLDYLTHRGSLASKFQTLSDEWMYDNLYHK